jgi:monoamine oxidase
MDADILIIGAGLAGLHCALRLSERFPKKTICILESYLIAGGRVHTVNGVEAGAGRIPVSHPMIGSYCDRYSLTRIPLKHDAEYMDEYEIQENLWPTCMTIIQNALATVPKSLLARYTLAEILTKIFDKEMATSLMAYFPYRSELTTLRADLALHSFANEFSNKESFYVIKEGLSSVIRGMETELEERGVKMLFEHRVTGMGSVDSFPMSVTVDVKDRGIKRFTARKIIFAVPSTALQAIRPFTAYPILKHLKMTPLLRIYATFPRPVWFEGMPKVVTPNPLRHIIPINPAKGTIMISYTDADDTKVWASLKKGALERGIMKQVRDLFSKDIKHIPDPLSMSKYYWEDGCTYWTPGLYDPAKESKDIMRPFPTRLPDLYVCGESYSRKQAWMEGALEHAEEMLERYFLHRS